MPSQSSFYRNLVIADGSTSACMYNAFVANLVEVSPKNVFDLKTDPDESFGNGAQNQET